MPYTQRVAVVVIRSHSWRHACAKTRIAAYCGDRALKIVILGAGQVGSSVAENLASEANDITIVVGGPLAPDAKVFVNEVEATYDAGNPANIKSVTIGTPGSKAVRVEVPNPDGGAPITVGFGVVVIDGASRWLDAWARPRPETASTVRVPMPTTSRPSVTTKTVTPVIFDRSEIDSHHCVTCSCTEFAVLAKPR